MSAKRKRFRCPKCGSLNVIKWGTQCGCQRFRCKDCTSSFTPSRPDVSASNRFVWFRKWISGKQRIEDIAKESGHSSRQISHIRTANDKLYWIRELDKWHEEYEEFISQKSANRETGEMTYTHDNIRRAYIHLCRAIPNMFKYVDEPDVPNNTNSLESFFGHLKDNLRIHRGLSREHQKNFIKWYLYFADEKKRKER